MPSTNRTSRPIPFLQKQNARKVYETEIESEQGQDATERSTIQKWERSRLKKTHLWEDTAEDDGDGEDSGESFHAGWRAMQKTANIKKAKRPQETSFNTEDHFWKKWKQCSG